MSQNTIIRPEVIEDMPFPGKVVVDDHVSQSTSNDTFSQPSYKDQSVPTKLIAQELIGSVLNTKSKKVMGEFEFADLGAFKAGTFKQGVSGEVAISKNGITAKDLAGLVTFALDALTGDAVFRGELTAGSVISGKVVVGNNTWIIDGDSERPRLLMYKDGIPQILLGTAD